MKRQVFTNPDSPLITIEPHTTEEFLQVLKDCRAYSTGPNAESDNIQRAVVLRYSQREYGPLKGQTYHEAVSGLTLFDVEQQDYDYFIGQ